MTTDNTPADLAKLQKQLGEDNANAVAEFVDGRISGLRDELTDLIGRQKANIDKAKESDDSEVKVSANDATKSVKEADAVVKAAESDPTPQKKAAAKQKMEEAEEKVSEVESDLQRIVALEHASRNHDERIVSLESHQTSETARLDQVSAMATANAHAIATGGTGDTLERAGRVALTTFMIVGVLYWLIWWLSPLDWSFLVNLGLALGAGALAGWVALTRGGTDQSSEATAEAEASSRSNVGLGIFRSAKADATANQNRAAANGSASAH